MYRCVYNSPKITERITTPEVDQSRSHAAADRTQLNLETEIEIDAGIVSRPNCFQQLRRQHQQSGWKEGKNFN